MQIAQISLRQAVWAGLGFESLAGRERFLETRRGEGELESHERGRIEAAQYQLKDGVMVLSSQRASVVHEYHHESAAKHLVLSQFAYLACVVYVQVLNFKVRAE